MTTEAPSPAVATGPLRPQEGLGALHLFYKVDLAAWRAQSPEECATARDHLEAVVAMARQEPQTQVVTLAMFAPADIGFMVLAPDMHALQKLEKTITASLGADVLVPQFTYLSMTEKSEYTPKDDEYALELEKNEGIARGSEIGRAHV